MKKLIAHETYTDNYGVTRSREIDLTSARDAMPSKYKLMFYFGELKDHEMVDFVIKNISKENLFELVDEKLKERDETSK